MFALRPGSRAADEKDRGNFFALGLARREIALGAVLVSL